MCKSCKMDPSEVKRLRERQGAVEVSDFDDEPRPRHPKRRAKKGRPRSATRNPCPETEDGKHVYVWAGYLVPWGGEDKVFYEHFGFYRREIKTCCGCMATTGYHRFTERYMKIKERKWRQLTGGEFAVKRGEPLGRNNRWRYRGFWSFAWEDDDVEYVAKKNAARERYWAWLRNQHTSPRR